jgi:hypothetical protein
MSSGCKGTDRRIRSAGGGIELVPPFRRPVTSTSSLAVRTGTKYPPNAAAARPALILVRRDKNIRCPDENTGGLDCWVRRPPAPGGSSHGLNLERKNRATFSARDAHVLVSGSFAVEWCRTPHQRGVSRSRVEARLRSVCRTAFGRVSAGRAVRHEHRVRPAPEAKRVSVRSGYDVPGNSQSQEIAPPSDGYEYMGASRRVFIGQEFMSDEGARRAEYPPSLRLVAAGFPASRRRRQSRSDVVISGNV